VTVSVPKTSGDWEGNSNVWLAYRDFGDQDTAGKDLRTGTSGDLGSGALTSWFLVDLNRSGAVLGRRAGGCIACSVLSVLPLEKESRGYCKI